MLGEVVAALPAGSTGILCADHRFAAIYPQPVCDRLLELFVRMNARLERVAIVASSKDATFYMQMRRIVREAGNDARQVFREPELALRHLASALTPEESVRARVFLERVEPR